MMKLLAKTIILLTMTLPLWADDSGLLNPASASAPTVPSDYCYKMLGDDQAKCNACMLIEDTEKKRECLSNVMSDLNSGMSGNPQ